LTAKFRDIVSMVVESRCSIGVSASCTFDRTNSSGFSNMSGLATGSALDAEQLLLQVRREAARCRSNASRNSRMTDRFGLFLGRQQALPAFLLRLLASAGSSLLGAKRPCSSRWRIAFGLASYGLASAGLSAELKMSFFDIHASPVAPCRGGKGSSFSAELTLEVQK
jgi:hypothetical protein